MVIDWPYSVVDPPMLFAHSKVGWENAVAVQINVRDSSSFFMVVVFRKGKIVILREFLTPSQSVFFRFR